MNIIVEIIVEIITENIVEIIVENIVEIYCANVTIILPYLLLMFNEALYKFLKNFWGFWMILLERLGFGYFCYLGSRDFGVDLPLSAVA